MFAHGETVTRLRAPLVEDRFNDEVPDWDHAVSVDIAGWGVSQDATSEAFETGRDATVSDFTLYRQESADVLPTDRLVIRGKTCEVVGDPFTWRSPFTGWQPGQVIKANVKEG